MTEIEHIRPTELANNPSYTHVVTARAARTLYISGQVAVDDQGDVVGVGDLRAQTDQTMKNLKIALDAGGATFDDVVKITIFVVDYQPDHRAVLAEVRGSYFSATNPPAATLIGVTALATPDFLVEIEAIAVTD